MKLERSSDMAITTVRLSERNLRELLYCLESDCEPTLSKQGDSVGGILIVTAESDADHYDEHGRAR